MKLLAALIFFTRLPFWRIAEVPPRYYKEVVSRWPLVGWLTGGIMALVFFIASQCVSHSVALLLALFARILLTGALHEDGLADFLDGMGGGTTREHILAIMKDSRIGTYGVIGLIAYFLLCYALLIALPVAIIPWVMWGCDAWSKACSAQLINLLPYARKEEESKAKVVYTNMSPGTILFTLLCGIAPLLPMLILRPMWIFAIPVPFLITLYIAYLLRKKIQGYTGDCNGATFLLAELSMYLSIHLLNTLSL